MLSVTTQVKNGMSAVRSRRVLRAVHFEAKQESPETSRKAGIRMLQKPYTEYSMSPSK